MKDSSVRIKVDTRQKLHKLKHQLELDSIDSVLNVLFKMANEHQRMVNSHTVSAEEFING